MASNPNASEAIALMTIAFMQKSETEFKTMLLDLIKLQSEPLKQATVVHVDIKLNDSQSRTLQTVKMLVGGDSDNTIFKTLLIDGLQLDTYIVLSALKSAAILRGYDVETDSDHEKD